MGSCSIPARLDALPWSRAVFARVDAERKPLESIAQPIIAA